MAWALVKDAQAAAFTQGVCDVIPPELLSLFTAEELQTLLSGMLVVRLTCVSHVGAKRDAACCRPRGD